MSARRYSDDEVRQILARAAEVDAAEPDRPWTLGQVEQVGAEAGLAPQAVAAAAFELERRAPGAERTSRYLGLPVAVSHAVPLSRGLSEEDWDRLVRRARETFAAEGRMQVSGGRREWRVGNLRVTHEPAGSGAVLELRTRKGDARLFVQLGVALLAVAAVAAVVAAAGAGAEVGPDAGDARRAAFAWLAALGGVLMLLVGMLRLPAWARARERQFESLAAFARGMSAP